MVIVGFDPKANIKVKRILQLSDSNIMKSFYLNIYFFFTFNFILWETGWFDYQTIILHSRTNILLVFFRYMDSLNLKILDFKELITARLGRNFLSKLNLVL